jgi:hypothetical protein
VPPLIRRQVLYLTKKIEGSTGSSLVNPGQDNTIWLCEQLQLFCTITFHSGTPFTSYPLLIVPTTKSYIEHLASDPKKVYKKKKQNQFG